MISYERINKLINIKQLSDVVIVAVGVGSGNATVISELAKCGLSNFVLIDHDVLEPSNLVRHVLGCSFLGRYKTHGMSDWLIDRNPTCKVKTIEQKFQDSPDFLSLLEGEQKCVVLNGVDNHLDRLHLNEVCVRTKTPMATGMVFQKGIGGMVFSYNPENGGCFSCLNNVSRNNDLSLNTLEQEETGYSEEEIYRQSLPRLEKSPGLSIDIGFISLIMARMTINLIHDFFNLENELKPMKFNTVIFSCSENDVIGGSYFETLNYLNILKQQDCCIC